MTVRIFGIICGVLLFVGTVVMYAPSSLINIVVKNNTRAFTYSHSKGFLWQGELENVVASGIYVGGVMYKLSPLSLLTGNAKMDLRLSGGAINGTGIIKMGTKNIKIQEGMFRVMLSELTNKRAFGVPVVGFVDVNLQNTFISRKGCHSGEGKLSTNFLTVSSRQYGVEGFVLAGPIFCENQHLIIELSGEGEDGAAQITVTIAPDLSYKLSATANPLRRDLAQALAFFGFEEGESGLYYEYDGNFREEKL